MFLDFFFTLRREGLPVSPTAFLTFHRAMHKGLVNSLDDLYIAARSILVKNEKHFDRYDQVFAHSFAGADLPLAGELDDAYLASAMLDQWLQNPKELAQALGAREEELAAMSPEELLEYFKARLKEQKSRHDGGSKWIGTGGTSPVGHSGYHPGGMRVGGVSRNRSAIKVAAGRRFRDYAADAPLTGSTIGEALKRLRNLVPQGARDRLNVDASIRQTIKNGGEIEIVFERALVDRLKVLLAIDNGGWSMEPHVHLVRTLFSHARSQFKELQTCYFHNTIYDTLWKDPARYRLPFSVDSLARMDPETRLVIVGDASMAPYELMIGDGSVYAFERSGRPSIERLRFLAGHFPHAVWLNPVPRSQWPFTQTIGVIGTILPMFELNLDGLEKAVARLLA